MVENNRNLLSNSYESWKSKIKGVRAMLPLKPVGKTPALSQLLVTGRLPLRALRENMFYAFLLAFGDSWKSLSFLGLQMHHSNVCLCLHMTLFSIFSVI